MTDLHHSSNLLLVMDCLWFNHAVLSSEPILPPTSKPTTPPPTISQSQTSLDSESDLFSSLPPEEEHSDSSDSSPATPTNDSLGDDTEEASEEGEPEYRYKRLRPTSLRTSPRRSRSHSSSPSLQSLTKTSSCKSLYELEYEEVKGFMDLGFKFKKDNLCPRMMSVLPGLQRLDEYKDGIEGLCTAMDESKDNQIKEDIDGKGKEVPRPYLSEAWLIRRPDSPLLNMRIPRISTSSPSEVKKHLKSWARTVATSIQLEY